MHSHDEAQFQQLVRQITERGHWQEGRNGRTKSLFGHSMRFSLTGGTVPFFTTKKTAWKTCLRELIWFVRGQTDNRILQQQNVHIWDGNATPEFLASRGLQHYPEGVLGPIYGYQWRHFNAPYDPPAQQQNQQQKAEGIDQLQQIVAALKDPQQRSSRRLVMTAWNPCQLDEMALPPCHVLCQFYVRDNRYLSCALYQRSCDVALGLSFNVASYSMLTHWLAHHCGLEADEFVHFIGDAHLYEDHVVPMQEVLERTPLPFPTLRLARTCATMEEYEVNDFCVEGYESHPAIQMKMVA